MTNLGLARSDIFRVHKIRRDESPTRLYTRLKIKGLLTGN